MGCWARWLLAVVLTAGLSFQGGCDKQDAAKSGKSAESVAPPPPAAPASNAPGTQPAARPADPAPSPVPVEDELFAQVADPFIPPTFPGRGPHCGRFAAANWLATSHKLGLTATDDETTDLGKALVDWTGLPLFSGAKLDNFGLKADGPLVLTWLCDELFALQLQIVDKSKLIAAFKPTGQRRLVLDQPGQPYIVVTPSELGIDNIKRKLAKLQLKHSNDALTKAWKQLRSAGDIQLAVGSHVILPTPTSRERAERFEVAAASVRIEERAAWTEVFLANRATETQWPAPGPAVAHLFDALIGGPQSARTDHPDAARLRAARSPAAQLLLDVQMWPQGRHGLLAMLDDGLLHAGLMDPFGGRSKAAKRLQRRIGELHRQRSELRTAQRDVTDAADKRLRQAMGPWIAFVRALDDGAKLYGALFPRGKTTAELTHLAVARWHAGSRWSKAGRDIAELDDKIAQLRTRRRKLSMKELHGMNSELRKRLLGTGSVGIGVGAAMGSGKWKVGGGGGGIGAIGSGGGIGRIGGPPRRGSDKTTGVIGKLRDP